MLSKAQIQFVNSLKLKKYRAEHQFFIAEGTKIVSEILQSDYAVHALFALPEWLHKNKDHTAKIKTVCTEVTEHELKKISCLSTPHEVLCVVKMKSELLNANELNTQLTLALDDLQDPGNLGTIIRIADWFGISTIICSQQTVDVYNPKVIQATMGSFLRIKIVYADLGEVLSVANKNSTNVYGALLNGENVYSTQLSRNGIIVLGNESKGISDKLVPHINKKILIPSFAKKQNEMEIDSLNVSIAAAILCSEFVRRN